MALGRPKNSLTVKPLPSGLQSSAYQPSAPHPATPRHVNYNPNAMPLLPDQARIDVKRLRSLLWNGHYEKACEAPGRIAGWAKGASALNDPAMAAGARRLVASCTELQAYIENNKGALIDCGQHYRAGKPISTSRAEGTVNQPVSARMNKRQQMRCSPRGAHRVLQVRATVLYGRFGHPAFQLAA